MHPKTPPDASSGSRTKSTARIQSAGAAALFLLMAGFPLLAPVAEAAPPSGWQIAIPIETDNAGNVYAPQVAVDGSGDAMAVWAQDDGARNNIVANRYAAGSGWGTATLIETDNAGDAHDPEVAVDGSGNAAAVWFQSDGTRWNIWANRYTAGSGWETATLIETDDTGNAAYPQVAFDRSGNAVAVWHQFDGTRNNVWANRYVTGSGWGTAALIETDNAGDAYRPQVAFDGSGNAVAVWQQADGTRFNIVANRYVAGSGWGSATLIETDDAGSAENPQVAVDRSGNALAVWQQSDGTRYNIWANHYAMGPGWGTATLIETDNAADAYGPQVAVDGSGNAAAVWYQYDGSLSNVWANRYAAGSGWGTPTLIERDNVDGAYSPQVAVDSSGNAVAVWERSDGTRDNIWANRYVAGSGWGSATLIETDNVDDANSPHVAVDSSGNALAVWEQYDGTRSNAWANRFVAADSTPPNVVVTAPSNGSATNGSSIWVAGTTEVGARVFVNGAAATVGADGSFGLLVALLPGENLLVATAWDSSGNSGSASVTVTYEDPVPILEDQLVAAQANLTAAQATVSALAVSAASTQTALAASQAREAALEANATAAKADLASAQSRITALETNGSAGQNNAASGQAGLAMLLAAIGIVVGAVGCALALRSRRPVVVKETVTAAAPPPPSPPPP
jgi:hypothetical protein